ncbi:MAG: AAA family ATPase [Bacteroidales bacterium]|nr:AAA family ATPase [Bacteroidales bacterium]
MGNITANITELRTILDRLPASHNLMLVGNHGIGKSEILTEYFNEKGMTVNVLMLGQMSDSGDILGLPRKNEVTGKTEFMPPYWWPTDGKPVCLFLDELNRARPELLQSVMDLCLNRRLAGRDLPEGSRLIAAINYGDNYQLTDLDPALVSRFNIINFRPSVEEWLLYAKKNGLDGRVIGFIEENHTWLDKDPDSKEGADTGVDKSVDRRAWKRVSDVILGRDSLDAVDSKLISSIVGPKATSAFLASASSKKLISGAEVLKDFEKCRKRLEAYELHELSIVSEGIFRHLELEKVGKDEAKTYAKNIDDYFTLLSKRKKEACAHFCTLFTNRTYPKAVTFISVNVPILTLAMVNYVEKL